jgi:hypothetical protein
MHKRQKKKKKKKKKKKEFCSSGCCYPKTHNPQTYTQARQASQDQTILQRNTTILSSQAIWVTATSTGEKNLVFTWGLHFSSLHLQSIN